MRKKFPSAWAFTVTGCIPLMFRFLSSNTRLNIRSFLVNYQTKNFPSIKITKMVWVISCSDFIERTQDVTLWISKGFQSGEILAESFAESLADLADFKLKFWNCLVFTVLWGKYKIRLTSCVVWMCLKTSPYSTHLKLFENFWKDQNFKWQRLPGKIVTKFPPFS